MVLSRQNLNKIIDITNQRLEGYCSCTCIEAHWQGELLVLYVDQPQGVTIEDCVAVTRRLAEWDGIDAVVGMPYELEVSSPGADRPLRTVSDFQAQLGEIVEVKLSQPVQGRRAGKGTLLAVEHGQLTISTSRGEWQFMVDEVLQAQLVFNWDKTEQSKTVNG